MTEEESKDAYAINGSYTGDNYGVSVTYGVLLKMEFFLHLKEDTYTAFNGYYTPEGRFTFNKCWL